MQLTHPLCVRWVVLGAALLGIWGLSLRQGPRALAEGGGDRLTSKPAPKGAPSATIKVGAEVRTDAGQRRRIVLPGGAILLVNQHTTLKCIGPDEITLSAGEVYADVSDGLTIKAPERTVRGAAGRWAVRVEKQGAAVVVTRGTAEVQGVEEKVRAGRQVAAGAKQVVAMPRASHVLDWTKDLLAAAASPSVPASQHAGGSLLAHDPDGQEAKISLRRFHIDVHIEDGFARTTIDQTYFNHESTQLEGTFYFPLPPDASLSRLAMYVDGTLMEGGMAERDHARNVYETIRYANRDPALLEWVDGSTFKMRVFPLEPRTEKRIVLSYTQRLPALFGRSEYRFPAGHSLQQVEQWSFHGRIKGGADLTWECPSHALKEKLDGADLVLTGMLPSPPRGKGAGGEGAAGAAGAKPAKLVRTDRDVAVQFQEKGDDAKRQAGARFSSTVHDGAQYLMVRYRPDFQSKIENQQSKIWTFLFEASGDRDPLLGRAQIEVIRNLLTHVDQEDRFLVATANTRLRWASAKPQAATRENIDAAVAFLESAHLIGALDLGNALEECSRHARRAVEGSDTILVHVGSGIPAMGESRGDKLLERLPPSAKYVGIGVGRRWNRAFMKSAAEKTSGHFTQVNPDEPIAWRAFDLFATLETPRLHNIQIAPLAPGGRGVGGEGDATPRFLTFTQSTAHGEEICAITRIGPPPGAEKTDGLGNPSHKKEPANLELPKSVLIRGTLDGKPVEYKLPVKDVAIHADYLPRTWAKLEIDRLLAENPLKHKDTVVNLSKAMYVMTPFTSLLVLEHEDLYTQYKVDRGRKDHWAMYACPEKVPVVYEPEPGMPDPRTLKAGQKLPAKMVSRTVVIRNAETAIQEDEIRFETAKELFKRGAISREDFGAAFPKRKKMVMDAEVGLRLVPAPSQGNIASRRPMETGGAAGVILQLADVSNLSAGTPDGAAPPDLRIPLRGSSFDFSTPPFGGFQYHGPAKVGQIIITGNEVTNDRVIRRVIGLHPGQTLRLPELRIAERELAGRDIFVLEDGHAMTDFYGWRGYPAVAFKELASSSILYKRPSYSGDDRIFFDLIGYASGMNTRQADIEAVLEAEALPSIHARAGQIDASARALIDKAREGGWRAWVYSYPALAGEGMTRTITFDGAGRHVYERELPPGIKERVVCDGKTLLHLYPQLHVGARRDVSRFHRADFAGLVPFVVPAAEDMARGADLKLVGERTVAIVPHFEARVADAASVGASTKPTQAASATIEWHRVHLVFGDDGLLAERQVVRMPKGAVVARQIIERDGQVRLLDEKGKEVHVVKGKLVAAKAPELTPETKHLVVLPLPYRTPEHVQKTLKIEKKNVQELRLAEALPLFAAYVGAGNAAEALSVFQRAIAAREQKQLGYYVLLASCGVNLDSQNADVLAEHQTEPLAQYLALHSSPVLRKHASQWAVGSASFSEGFLQHLATTHALYQRWQNPRVLHGDPAKVRQERARAFDYVKKNKDSVFGWCLLSLMQDRAMDWGADLETKKLLQRDDKDLHRELAEAFKQFEDHAALGYAARYEHARSLFRAGLAPEARKRFLQLYEHTFKDEMLPAIDPDFRAALLAREGEPDAWIALMRETASQLVKQKRRPAVLALAYQAHQLDDQPLANTLLDVALSKIDDAKERTALTLAGIDFLWQTNQIPQADDLLQKLSGDKKDGLGNPSYKKDGLGNASYWRKGVQFAELRDMPARGLECLERALDAEFQKLPETVDLQTVRAEYGKLLEHYSKLAESMVTLKVKPAPEFLAKVVRAADRWRALDRDADQPCTSAAWILHRLGEKELSWDYLTTPVALKPNEASGWLSMASNLSRKGDLLLADRAYKAAFEAEPTNAQILWDRAENLRRAAKNVEAQALYRQIAEGTWQPRFQGLVSQARGQLREQ